MGKKEYINFAQESMVKVYTIGEYEYDKTFKASAKIISWMQLESRWIRNFQSNNSMSDIFIIQVKQHMYRYLNHVKILIL